MLATLSLLLSKMLPVYSVALGGFFAGRYLNLQRETLANLLIYFVAPVVFFFGVVQAPHGWTQLLLVPVFLGVGSLLGVSVYAGVKRLYPQQERSILGFIAGSGNTGYFGIPLVAVLLGPDALVVAIMVTIGLDLFQYTVGYYLMARHSARSEGVLQKIAKNPLIWALAAGTIWTQMGWGVPAQVAPIAAYFNGTYIILGMLVIGLGLSGPRQQKIDVRFVAGAFIAKFVLFPLVVALLVMVDRQFLHIFSDLTHKAVLLLSLVPIASDAVAFATILDIHPQKTAHTVMLSSVFSILYVPVLAYVFF